MCNRAYLQGNPKEERLRMQHLAIIPDGNRRWASKNKLQAIFGHKKGMEAVRTAIDVCVKNNIKYLSFYTFSLENFRRSEEEKSYLFDLIADGFKSRLSELIAAGVRIRFIGDRNYFPERISHVIADIENQTQHLSALNLSLLFCYGSRGEVVDTVKRLAQKIKDGFLAIEDITEETISDSLWTAGIPDPDLIVRTSGIVRISNFLLYQAAYSEFSFLNCYWPEVTSDILEECINKFQDTQRNFGK